MFISRILPAKVAFINNGRGDVICKRNVILDCQLYSIDARDACYAKASIPRVRYENNVCVNAYRLCASDTIPTDVRPVSVNNIIFTNQTNKIKNLIADPLGVVVILDDKTIRKGRCTKSEKINS